MHAPVRLSWWQRLTTALRSSWTAPLSASSPELARLWQAPSVSSGVSVSEATALTYSAVWAAVALIAGDVASLPLILYKRRPDGGRERYADHPLYRLLHDAPNDEMGSMTFRETLTAHLLTWGNAYAEIERDVAGRVVGLWPLTPDRVAPLRQAGGTLSYQIHNATGADTFLRPADVLHLPGLGYDGTIGYSVIAKARESLGLGLAAERFGGAFFGNGAQFGGVLSHPNVLSDQGRKHLRESIESRHQGVERAHRFLMLEEGISYQSLGVPPDDAQFLETRQFQVEEVARWFSVPPHKIGDLRHATFSNIEHQGIDYLQSSLRRWLVRWEQEINRKLIAPSERRLQYVEHLTDALLRGDIQSRYAAYAIGRQWGWLSVDDIRERENMNPLPAGQGSRYLVPLNMVPADRLDEVIDKQVQDDPPPPPPPPRDETEGSEPEGEATAEAERTIQILRTDLELARTEANTAQAGLQVAQAARQRAETEAGVAGAVRLEVEAREQELRERVATADATVSDLTTKLALLEELRVAVANTPVFSPEDVITPVVAQVEAAQQATTAGLAVVTERQETLEAVTDEVREQLGLLTQRLGLLEHAAEQAVLVPPDVVTGEQLHTLRDALQAQTVAAVEAVVAGVRHERTEAEDAAARAQAARDAQVVAAHRALLVEAGARLLRIETDRARRAATPEKLARWIEQFYPTHTDVAVSVLLPAVRAELAWRGAGAAAEAVTQRVVGQYIDTSVRELRLALAGDPEEVSGAVARTLARWETTRAGALADAILEEAHGH